MTENTDTTDAIDTQERPEDELSNALDNSEDTNHPKKQLNDELKPPGDTDQGDTEQSDDDQPEMFERAYVERLRAENQRYRERAKAAEGYAPRLHTELVRATGRLADPTDLPFDQAHLEDPDALGAAIEDLLAKKPHLASRTPVGDVGQGHRGSPAGGFSLLGMLKERT